MTARDAELAKRLRRRDAGAFGDFYDAFAAPLHAYLVRLVRDAALAEDLLQDTMLRVHTNIDRYDERGAFRGWVFRIATNAAFGALRRMRGAPVTPWDARTLEVADPFTPDPHAGLDRERRTRTLACGLAALPDEQRAVFLLRAQQGLPLAEIASVLGIPEGTVKSRLHHAVRSLRTFVAGAADG